MIRGSKLPILALPPSPGVLGKRRSLSVPHLSREARAEVWLSPLSPALSFSPQLGLVAGLLSDLWPEGTVRGMNVCSICSIWGGGMGAHGLPTSQRKASFCLSATDSLKMLSNSCPYFPLATPLQGPLALASGSISGLLSTLPFPSPKQKSWGKLHTSRWSPWPRREKFTTRDKATPFQTHWTNNNNRSNDNKALVTC